MEPIPDPLPDRLRSLLEGGADPLAAMAEGAGLLSDPLSRFRWFRAWLEPEALGRNGLRARAWAPVMAGAGVHPLSLLFSARTESELDCYRQIEPGCGLPGRLEVVVERWDLVTLGHWGAAVQYEGGGKTLQLPEGLVIDSALVLRDWQLPAGWPVRFLSSGPLCLDRCRGNLAFPRDFSMGGGFRASHCQGLRDLPPGPLRQILIRDCDITAVAGRAGLRELSLVSCPGLSRLGEFPDLERLNLCRCPGLAELPSLPSPLVSLILRHCPGLTGLRRPQ